jgi:hypothetical protein
LEKEFIQGIQPEGDDAQLVLGKFTLKNPQEATAPISIGTAVAPGDYLVKMASRGISVVPQSGNIIRIQPK